MTDGETRMALLPINDIDSLENQLSEPDDALVKLMARLEGDIALLGVGGKMGPTMARMAQRAMQQAGAPRRIYGVSRFSDTRVRERLDQWGIETIVCDLLDPNSVNALPDCANVIYLVGFKFGASQAAPTTWAINCQVPSLVSRRYTDSRIVAMSSGNVYGMVPCDSQGSQENHDPNPIGEYAMAALGRERMFQYFSEAHGVPVAILRLNYATELRYGVLVDIARTVWSGQPVNLAMPAVNVIWLRDANLMTLMALDHCTSPASIINVAGGDLVRVADVAMAFADRFDKKVLFEGEAGTEALLSDGSSGHRLLGRPPTTLENMLDWTADWVRHDRPQLGKPTHFQVRDGKF